MANHSPPWNGVNRRKAVVDCDDCPLNGWRSTVEHELNAINKRLDNGAKEIEANTELTKKIDEKLTPIAKAWDAETWDTLRGGLRVMTGIWRFGEFCTKHWRIILGVGLFLWAWTHGESIDTAVRAFWRGVSGGDDK